MNFYINRQLCKNISNFEHTTNVKFYYNIYQTKKEENGFYFGTIEDIDYLSKLKLGIFNNSNDDIIDYLPFLQKEYLNFDGAFYSVEQLNQIPKGEWFCRSNSGNKLLRGQLLTNETIHYIYKNLNPKNVIYISKWKELDGEMRFWCINGKIADYSSYCTFGKDSKYYGDLDLLRAVDYVHHVNKIWMPGDLFVIDICKYNNEYKVVEYNGFSTSGFYNANLNKICDKLEEYFKEKNE